MPITTLPTHAGSVPLHFRVPKGTPRGAVVVLHQAHGMTPHVHDWLSTFADEGYLAVAPALHHRRGVETIDPMAEFGGDLALFSAALPSDEQFLEDFAAVLAVLAEDLGIPAAEVSVVGFSYGGRAAYLAATRFPIASSVSWYPVGIHRKNFHGNGGLPALELDRENPSAPWLGLNGTDDQLLAPGELEEWQHAINESGNPRAEIINYPGAGHAFDVKGGPFPGAPSPFHEAAFNDALLRTRAHLNNHQPLTSERTLP